MMRLFIAIDIPSALRSGLHDMGREIQGARPVPADQLHLTLRFIGDVETQALFPLKEGLGTLAISPFSLELQGVGRFPLRGAPRVVWAGVNSQQELTLLHSRIEDILEQLGYAKETRPFAPHLTLARMKTAATDSLRQFLARYTTYHSAPFPVEHVNLYSSKLTPAGAIHRLEAAYPLEVNRSKI
jgi:RNA 2',3'-cyclic 3'-phosphodiesterase